MSGRLLWPKLKFGPFGWWIRACRNRVKLDPELSTNERFADNREPSDFAIDR